MIVLGGTGLSSCLFIHFCITRIYGHLTKTKKVMFFFCTAIINPTPSFWLWYDRDHISRSLLFCKYIVLKYLAYHPDFFLRNENRHFFKWPVFNWSFCIVIIVYDFRPTFKSCVESFIAIGAFLILFLRLQSNDRLIIGYLDE